MTSFVPSLLGLFLAISLVEGFNQPLHVFRNNLHRKHQELFATEEPDAVVDCYKDPLITENWFVQKLDQFNASDKTTYEQRYFTNWRYHKNETNDKQPVVFLMVGGEGEMSMRWNCWENLTYMTMAKENEAIVIQLEHRFFGKNRGLKDLSTPSLTYLTTEQALADMANFIPNFNSANGLVKPRWVIFGGSYPGSLTAWFRLKYPDLSVGGVASSAPLWPKVNFWEYSDVMESTIRATSEDCYKSVGDAFKDMKSLTFNETGRGNLSGLFKIQPPLQPVAEDITAFFGYIFGAFQDVIQYTYDGSSVLTQSVLTIKELCNVMTDPKVVTPIERLAKAYTYVATARNRSKEQEPMITNYAESIKNFTNVSLEGPEASMRGWMWLSCNEFGWLQTTDKGDSLFGDILSLGSFNKLCLDLFGQPMSTKYIERQVLIAERSFGNSWNYKAKNVILPNGGFDPWSALGTNQSYPEDHQIALTTPGAAHCSDMYPMYPNEPKGLNATRTRIREEVAYYLKSALSQPPPPPPPAGPGNQTKESNGNIGFSPTSISLLIPVVLLVLLVI